jgi:hypothetical protein
MTDNSLNNDQFSILQELLSAIYIQLARNYDLLCLIAKDDDKVLELHQRHTEGKVFAPPPNLMIEEDDE